MLLPQTSALAQTPMILEATTWTLTYDAVPLTHNRSDRMHHHERARIVREWREAFAWLAREARVTPQERISVHVQAHYTRTQGKHPDTASSAPSAKASIDGLVDAGVIPDDGPRYLSSITFLPPEMGAAKDGLTLTVVVE